MKDDKKHHEVKKDAARKRVIRLDDLDWEDEVTGGSGKKLFFGEQPESSGGFDDLLKPGQPPKKP